MDPPQQKSQLFQVYLRLRPSPQANLLYPTLAAPERFLSVEEAQFENELPTHVTLNPPNDNRRRAVEKFAFTKVFEEDTSQLEIFEGTGVLPLVEGVLGAHGDGRDGLLATLGVTGSGKSHTILGSRSQRGLTQLALEVLFRSIQPSILDPSKNHSLHATIAASDASEAQVMSAPMYLETMYGDTTQSRASSRAPTPMVVRSTSGASAHFNLHPSSHELYPSLQVHDTGSPKSIRIVVKEQRTVEPSIVTMPSAPTTPHFVPSFMRMTRARSKKSSTKLSAQGEPYTPAPTPLRKKPSAIPRFPDISNVHVNADEHAEYAILISMYEVYNDRIFDLLTPALPGKSTKDSRRRALLFKPTEASPDRKVVAGLRKIVCGSLKEALLVLEAGLCERRVAGTGSNSVSSRSHGFFCVEVKKRSGGRMPGRWGGSTMTIVDLAGSERARDAKTQGQTLQEAGKINESLMYLGQCLQMQSDMGSTTKPNLVPFRQCKLTELLFSNSFPNSSSNPQATPHHQLSHQGSRNPQRAIMIVTADPLGDFNATSQILRYSALAREVTVPRIPSVTSTILASSVGSNYFHSRGRMSPTDTERETMEIAALEIARMSEEIDGLRSELTAEQERRFQVEAHLESFQASMDDRLMERESDVREECYVQLAAELGKQMRQWKTSWEAENERNDEHLDKKIEILTRITDVEDEDKENIPSVSLEDVMEPETENQKLRREVEILRRELHNRSPTKQKSGALREKRSGVLREIGGSGLGSGAGLSSLGHDMDRLRVSGESDSSANSLASAKKLKVRKLPVRKWDMGCEDEL
ncbi:kinesin family protein-like protein [Calycina marina]|uniref:Kinesin-like protein n=1 Tax=Calycina marina TaxID=1763456 RepID=A0A9P8CIM3_9HELO|nr:kinesin family protein-like protein [Calycina marina]